MEVYINSVEYDAEWDFTLCEQAGNKTTSTVSVLVENQPVPVAGDIIEIQDNGSTIFWGTCGIPKSPKFSTGLETKVYKITCGNANSILSNRIINVAYQNYTVTEIVQDIFTNYVAEEGIALGQISTVDVSLEAYTAKDYNLQTALNELADLVGAVWKIDNDKKFYFLAEADFPTFPNTISEDFLLGSEMQHTTKDYKTRTVQYVSGAKDYTTTQVENYTYTADLKNFVLTFPIASRPSIYVNDVAVPSTQIGINGIDDDNPNIVFSFSYNSQVISYKSTTFLAVGDDVRFEYIGLFDIRVSAYNATKIAEIAELTGTSGLRENVYIATDVASTADALQLAQSLLQQFESATNELTFWLLSSQLYALGMTIDDVDLLTQMSFNLPSINISGDYVITERTLSPAYGNLDNVKEKFKVTLKLMNRDYLRSYAETLSDLRRDINQLTIRGDDVVISSVPVDESLQMDEATEPFSQYPHYPVAEPTETQMSIPWGLSGSFFPLVDVGGFYYYRAPIFPANSIVNNSLVAPTQIPLIPIYPG